MEQLHKKIKRHKFKQVDESTKLCIYCDSRIQNKIGFSKYYEGGTTCDYVNFYPRCLSRF